METSKKHKNHLNTSKQDINVDNYNSDCNIDCKSDDYNSDMDCESDDYNSDMDCESDDDNSDYDIDCKNDDNNLQSDLLKQHDNQKHLHNIDARELTVSEMYDLTEISSTIVSRKIIDKILDHKKEECVVKKLQLHKYNELDIKILLLYYYIEKKRFNYVPLRFWQSYKEKCDNKEKCDILDYYIQKKKHHNPYDTACVSYRIGKTLINFTKQELHELLTCYYKLKLLQFLQSIHKPNTIKKTYKHIQLPDLQEVVTNDIVDLMTNVEEYFDENRIKTTINEQKLFQLILTYYKYYMGNNSELNDDLSTNNAEDIMKNMQNIISSLVEYYTTRIKIIKIIIDTIKDIDKAIDICNTTISFIINIKQKLLDNKDMSNKEDQFLHSIYEIIGTYNNQDNYYNQYCNIQEQCDTHAKIPQSNTTSDFITTHTCDTLIKSANDQIKQLQISKNICIQEGKIGPIVSLSEFIDIDDAQLCTSLIDNI